MITTPVQAQQPADVVAIEGLNILVAEDSSINVMIMKKLMAGINSNIVYVENGELAVAAVKEGSYDVVLMDIYMPHMDGYEATQLIRQMDDKAKASVYIIALTAAMEANLEKKLTEAGFNDHISKPLNVDELKQKIIAYLSKN